MSRVDTLRSLSELALTDFAGSFLRSRSNAGATVRGTTCQPCFLVDAASADPTTHRESRPALDATAAALGLTLREAIVGTPEQIERSLREAKDGGAVGVNVLSSALLFALRGQIIKIAAGLGLPAIYQWPETADEGGLIAYGPSLRGAFRQVTTLVDKILKGAKPGDIPVEQPTRFSLVINLKTASTLGLTVPPLTLLRADRAIE